MLSVTLSKCRRKYLIELLREQGQQVAGCYEVDNATVAFVKAGGTVDYNHVGNEVRDSKGQSESKAAPK